MTCSRADETKPTDGTGGSGVREMSERFFRRRLLGFPLRATRTAAGGYPVDLDFDHEDGGMGWSAPVHEMVGRDALSPGLQPLLQRALEVAVRGQGLIPRQD